MKLLQQNSSWGLYLIIHPLFISWAQTSLSMGYFPSLHEVLSANFWKPAPVSRKWVINPWGQNQYSCEDQGEKREKSDGERMVGKSRRWRERPDGLGRKSSVVTELGELPGRQSVVWVDWSMVERRLTTLQRKNRADLGGDLSPAGSQHWLPGDPVSCHPMEWEVND